MLTGMACALFSRSRRRSVSSPWAKPCCRSVHTLPYDRAGSRESASHASIYFWQLFGACRRRTLHALSDATLQFDLALGVCRRHVPKVAKNRAAGAHTAVRSCRFTRECKPRAHACTHTRTRPIMRTGTNHVPTRAVSHTCARVEAWAPLIAFFFRKMLSKGPRFLPTRGVSLADVCIPSHARTRARAHGRACMLARMVCAQVIKGLGLLTIARFLTDLIARFSLGKGVHTLRIPTRPRAHARPAARLCTHTPTRPTHAVVNNDVEYRRLEHS